VRAMVVWALILSIAALGAAPAADPDRVLVGGVSLHTVARGESLRSIGSRFGIDTATLAGDNALRTAAVLTPGQLVILDNRHIVPVAADEGVILVNVPQRMLFYRTAEEVWSAPVAVGSRAWATPLAPFEVVAREQDPTWDVPESIAAEARAKGQTLPAKIGPGPNNPLGRHWLGLSVGSIGIHGTNAPSSVYRAATHGCIRVHPDDISVLFDRVEVGTRGETIYEPVLLADDGANVFLEVHPDVYRRSRVGVLDEVRALASKAGMLDSIDWARARQVAADREGIARIVTAARVPRPHAGSTIDPGSRMRRERNVGTGLTAPRTDRRPRCAPSLHP